MDQEHDLVYVTSFNCPVLLVVDGATDAVVQGLLLEDYPEGVAANSKLGKAYVCAGTSLIEIGADHAIASVLPLSGRISRCASDDRTGRIFAAGRGSSGDTANVIVDRAYANVPASGAIPADGLQLSLLGPNPVRLLAGGLARFAITTHRPGRVALEIRDVQGRTVRAIELAEPPSFGPGTRAIAWDGRGANGSVMPAGLYFARASWRGPGGERQVSPTRSVVVLR